MRHRTRPPLALAYHGIEEARREDDPLGLIVTPRDLTAHVRLLRRWGYDLVTFGELARRAREHRAAGCAALTFDDGLADNCTTLLPLLQTLGVGATVFVVTSWIGGYHPHVRAAPVLSVDQLRTLAGTGVEIGAHSHSHRDLVSLSFEDAAADLGRSKAILEDVLQRQVTVAAYPFGNATEQTKLAAQEAGFVAACRLGVSGSWSDPFDLPRQGMGGDSSLLSVWLQRDGRYDLVMRWRQIRAALRARRHGSVP